LEVMFCNICLLQFDVGNRQGPNPLATVVDVSLGKIDAHEASTRIAGCQGNDVASGRTPEFEDACLKCIGCFEAEQLRQGSQACWLRIGERHGGIRQGIVVFTSRALPSFVGTVGHWSAFKLTWIATSILHTVPRAFNALVAYPKLLWPLLRSA